MIAPTLFTVFTPTYNRAQTLHRVYESLLAQTYRDFEWLVIDDGSTDSTATLVSGWKNDPRTWFPLRYIWQENQHKKVAHNRAVREARGALFVILDSDDRCVPEALERLAHHWFAIPVKERDGFAGVCGLSVYENGRPASDRFPGGEWTDSNRLEMRHRHRVLGEQWCFYRTDVLRQHLFPEDIPGHVPEWLVWGEIAKNYKTRFINEPLRIYFQDVKGGFPQLTKFRNPAAGAVGATVMKHKILSEEVSYFRYRPLFFLAEAARLTRFYLQIEESRRSSVRFWPTSVLGKVLVIGAWPLGIALWIRDRFLMRGAT